MSDSSRAGSGTEIEREQIDLTLTPEDIERLEKGESVKFSHVAMGMVLKVESEDYDDE